MGSNLNSSQEMFCVVHSYFSPSLHQCSWTAADVCRRWPCVSACCQRPAWLRPAKSFHGASRTRGHFTERLPRQTETRCRLTQGRSSGRGVPACAREREVFNEPSPRRVGGEKGLFSVAERTAEEMLLFFLHLRMRKRSMFILQGCQFVFYLTFRVDSELISQDSYEIFLCDLITPWRKAPERSYGTSRAPSSKFIQFPGPLCKNDTNTEPEVVIWQ